MKHKSKTVRELRMLEIMMNDGASALERKWGQKGTQKPGELEGQGGKAWGEDIPKNLLR